MSKLKIRPFVSPTCVLLALDWADGETRNDFLGFAIRRSPGFWGQPQSWLPNIIGFDGPAAPGEDRSSNLNPIQKFLWWDARINDEDRGKLFTYEAIPVVATKAGAGPTPHIQGRLTLLQEFSRSVTITIPFPVEKKIGTYFNRAVVSSQAFSKKFGGDLSGERLRTALSWLANGLEVVIPEFLQNSSEIEGAIYHLTDSEWVIPSFQSFPGEGSLVYNRTRKDNQNADAVELLKNKLAFHPRTRASIMHNKFLVRLKKGHPSSVLIGSANFTTPGLTTQANLLHTFDSPELALLYFKRKQLLQNDPSLSEIAKKAAWSKVVRIGDASVRVFFSPEEKGERKSIDTIVRTIRKAKNSVLFCLFMPTDADLRSACFEAGDRGKMMFGLVNKIPNQVSTSEASNAGQEAQIEIYHRSRKNRDVFSHSLFAGSDRPKGFWWESANLPGSRSRWPVYIHHKFIIIDAESENPVIYSGSANMSKNSLYRNDENLLEIKQSPRLAAIYLTEFLRLYEHYRARAAWNRYQEGRYTTYRLKEDSSWAKKHYTRGTPEYRARISMAG